MIAELLNINLVKELGLDSLPEEKKNVLIGQMSDVVENRINLEILSLLSEPQKQDLDKVIDSNGDMQGPFPIRFDPAQALFRDQRKILDMTASSWLAFRDFNGLCSRWSSSSYSRCFAAPDTQPHWPWRFVGRPRGS